MRSLFDAFLTDPGDIRPDLPYVNVPMFGVGTPSIDGHGLSVGMPSLDGQDDFQCTILRTGLRLPTQPPAALVRAGSISGGHDS